MTGEEILGHCLAYFGNHDRANAAIHCKPVRYSPITFELARMINASFDPNLLPSETLQVLWDVTNHMGSYEMDGGR